MHFWRFMHTPGGDCRTIWRVAETILILAETANVQTGVCIKTKNAPVKRGYCEMGLNYPN